MCFIYCINIGWRHTQLHSSVQTHADSLFPSHLNTHFLCTLFSLSSSHFDLCCSLCLELSLSSWILKHAPEFLHFLLTWLESETTQHLLRRCSVPWRVLSLTYNRPDAEQLKACHSLESKIQIKITNFVSFKTPFLKTTSIKPFSYD